MKMPIDDYVDENHRSYCSRKKEAQDSMIAAIDLFFANDGTGPFFAFV